MIFNFLSHFYLLNRDIPVTIYVIEMNSSVCAHKVPLKERVSQIFNIGPSFFFMSKNG